MSRGPEWDTPTLDTLERRIWQLILLMTVVILYLTLLLVALQVSGFMGISDVIELPENAFKYAVSLAVLILLFCSYVVLHHRKLFRVSRALLEEQKRTESLDRNLRTVKSLLEVSSGINAKKKLSTLLDLIARETMAAFAADSASIMLLEPGTGVLKTMSSCGRGAEQARNARVGMGESVAGWVAANGKPLLLNGQVSAGDYSGAEPREMPVASSLCLPLESGNRSIGVMSVNRYEEGDPFTPEDLELITVFANNAAIAIHNAGMYAKLREFSSDLERKVRERTRQLEVANRAKSDFLASVSHELRTPLHAITGFCDVLLKERHGSLNPDQREYAREIQTAGNRLLAIIDGVLDFSAAEAGRMDLSLEDVPLVPVVRNAPAPVNKRVQDKGLRMETHWDESLEGASIRANPGGLEQVLSHLLSNAVEFTRPGGAVRVEAAAVEDCGARLRELEAEGLISTGERGRHKGMDGLQGVELSVSDDGEGIPPDQRFRVFEPFFQGGEGLSGNRPGTGLGLARAQRLVEVHGGRIWAESEGKGKGSRFAFLLPLDPEGNGRPQPPNDAARGR